MYLPVPRTFHSLSGTVRTGVSTTRLRVMTMGWAVVASRMSPRDLLLSVTFRPAGMVPTGMGR